jgi:hypothetical protein
MAKEPIKTAEPVVIPKPHIEVMERGLQNPFGLPSTPIDLKDPQFETHWCNTAIGAGQYAKYLDAGYLPVRPEYLKDADRCPHQVSPDGYVARGQRCEEVLMYSLKSHIRARQREKQKRNLQDLNPMRTHQALTEAASEKLGDKAAEFLSRARPLGSVKDQYERIERLPSDDLS